MPLADVIVNLVHRAMKLIRTNSAVFQVFGSRYNGNKAERGRTIRLLEAVIEPVQDLLRQHSEALPHPDPERAGSMLVVMMHGIIEWGLLLRESSTPLVPVTDEELALETVRAVLGYLGLPPIDANSEFSWSLGLFAIGIDQRSKAKGVLRRVF